ncbi:MAG: crossover junction endodeoxyribonuclease RuvC [Salinivirgaceae bacterium]|nr:crossover junction endodeoxyribonuclease RuvC [Salinivirgaceae bacterium]
MSDRVILGIDPGTSIMGYGVVEINNKTPKLVTMGIIDLRKLDDHYIKLSKIFERTIGLIESFMPDELAIEAPFFGKNVQSMLKLGRAQGVAIAAGISRQIPIFEYAPRKIKMSITGNGNASKEQVASILQHTLNFKELPKDLDATDGLAAAMCHFYQRKPTNDGKSYNSWKDFISKNQGRVK